MNSTVLITLIICLTLVISQVINLARDIVNPKSKIGTNPKPGLNYHDNNELAKMRESEE